MRTDLEKAIHRILWFITITSFGIGMLALIVTEILALLKSH